MRATDAHKHTWMIPVKLFLKKQQLLKASFKILTYLTLKSMAPTNASSLCTTSNSEASALLSVFMCVNLHAMTDSEQGWGKKFKEAVFWHNFSFTSALKAWKHWSQSCPEAFSETCPQMNFNEIDFNKHSLVFVCLEIKAILICVSFSACVCVAEHYAPLFHPLSVWLLLCTYFLHVLIKCEPVACVCVCCCALCGKKKALISDAGKLFRLDHSPSPPHLSLCPLADLAAAGGSMPRWIVEPLITVLDCWGVGWLLSVCDACVRAVFIYFCELRCVYNLEFLWL